MVSWMEYVLMNKFTKEKCKIGEGIVSLENVFLDHSKCTKYVSTSIVHIHS